MMLIAITIQKISNLKTFGSDGKDPHMIPLNDIISKNIPKMKTFLDEISEIPITPIDEIPVEHKTIDFGLEMATVMNFIIESLDPLKQTFGKENPVVVKLVLTLKHLRSVGFFGDSRKSRKIEKQLSNFRESQKF
eukprot:TRINITY_DN1629_c0_g2_i3.p1 TRINITY_DN1629_c0_g2~~TRINITY_DN1629_c0_g2_i3.p1  ORF type:complete len:135 (-),score=19.04 TRINITY_DN1629_c0_g2_i3:79-483(-)